MGKLYSKTLHCLVDCRGQMLHCPLIHAELLRLSGEGVLGGHWGYLGIFGLSGDILALSGTLRLSEVIDG